MPGSGRAYLHPFVHRLTAGAVAGTVFFHTHLPLTSTKLVYIRDINVSIGCNAPVAATTIGWEIYKAGDVASSTGFVQSPVPRVQLLLVDGVNSDLGINNNTKSASTQGSALTVDLTSAKKIADILMPASTGVSSGPTLINLKFSDDRLGIMGIEIAPGESFGVRVHPAFAAINGQYLNGSWCFDEVQI